MDVNEILCIVYPFYKMISPSPRVLREWKKQVEDFSKKPNAFAVVFNDLQEKDFALESKEPEGEFARKQALEFFNFVKSSFGEKRNAIQFVSFLGLPEKLKTTGLLPEVKIYRMGQHAGEQHCVAEKSRQLRRYLLQQFPQNNFELQPMNVKQSVEFSNERMARIRERFITTWSKPEKWAKAVKRMVQLKPK